jgi:hypothetical protein
MNAGVARDLNHETLTGSHFTHPSKTNFYSGPFLAYYSVPIAQWISQRSECSAI